MADMLSSHRALLSGGSMMEAKHSALNLRVAILQKRKKQMKSTLMMFLFSRISPNCYFQHEAITQISVRYFTSFLTNSLVECVCYLYATFQLGQALFSMFNRQEGLDSAGVGALCFVSKGLW